MTTNYRRGRDFEYRVRDAVLREGAAFVGRAAGSRTKVDLVALWPATPGGEGSSRGAVWLVQCKRDGRLPRAERAALQALELETGHYAYLAKAGAMGRGVTFERITKEPGEPGSVGATA